MDASDLLERLADDFASVVPAVDAGAEHDRWQSGIDPFEEERQVEMLREAVDGDTTYSIETEAPYLDGGQRVDLFIKSEEIAIPVEAKLLRFRYDNGNIDPNSFAKVFSPFPERTTSTLLTANNYVNPCNNCRERRCQTSIWCQLETIGCLILSEQ